MANTMISASDTSLVASAICFSVPERTLDAMPAGVFVTPIRQQLTVRRKLWLNNTFTTSCVVLRSRSRECQTV